LKLVDNLIAAQDHWLQREMRGWVLKEAGKFTEAAKVYEDVLAEVRKDKELDDEEREEFVEKYRYALSTLYVDADQVDKAAEQLKALIAKRPDEPGYYNDLGYIWADRGQNLEESEKLIRKALDLDRKRRKAQPNLKPEEDRDNGAYLDSLGWVLFKQ